MASWLFATVWSPYAVGIGIGLLGCLTLLVSSKPIGCSTAFSRMAGMIEKFFRGVRMGNKLYYQEVKLEVDWQWMFVAGITVGAFISALLSSDFHWQWIPAQWSAAFGDDRLIRIITALCGGVLLGLGARWADGCTSGHGISGTMQLAVSSWISAICFFIGGIAGAWILFHWIV
ncbi:MAG: YeeE/YedE family protein [Deltaproteobacteria bacterium]|nr:YeeE/YedE family protein [Deltaproteobacteria bacterium]